jgi:hypothetical protein
MPAVWNRFFSQKNLLFRERIQSRVHLLLQNSHLATNIFGEVSVNYRCNYPLPPPPRQGCSTKSSELELTKRTTCTVYVTVVICLLHPPHTLKKIQKLGSSRS